MDTRRLCFSLLVVLCGWYLQFGRLDAQPPRSDPAPHAPVIRRPLREAVEASGAPKVGGEVSPDGKPIVCPLPMSERKRNIASRGLGCCVFRSLDHASRWQNDPQLWGFPEWMVKSGVPGGGYPQKVDQLIPRIAKDRGMPTPEYVQYEGGDYGVIKAILASGRMACVTYNGHDPHYAGSISHMVNVVYADDLWVCVFDNNFIDELVWMSPEAFMQRFGGDGGWAVCLLNGPPPPVPWN